MQLQIPRESGYKRTPTHTFCSALCCHMYKRLKACCLELTRT